MNALRSTLLGTLVLALTRGMPAAMAQPPELILRCDDIGMCHTVNMALQRVLEKNIPLSVSMMATCPWFEEAVEILRAHPSVAVGIHLTLNAEWKGYRWGPLAGRSAVPSLVDSTGSFFPSRALFFAHEPSLREVETELRAQIERGMMTGLKIDYVDYHMGTAVDRPDLRALVERLAAEYHLGISRYFGETDVSGLYGTEPAKKTDTLVALAQALTPGSLGLMVFHVGLQTPEMDALVDLNPSGLTQMSRHREAELQALTSERFLSTLKEKGVRLLNYRDLVEKSQKSPR